jgi:hypothetical protein
VLLPLAVYWQQRLYRRHTRKVLFMLDAIENSDTSVQLTETSTATFNHKVSGVVTAVVIHITSVPEILIDDGDFYSTSDLLNFITH